MESGPSFRMSELPTTPLSSRQAGACPTGGVLRITSSPALSSRRLPRSLQPLPLGLQCLVPPNFSTSRKQQESFLSGTEPWSQLHFHSIHSVIMAVSSQQEPTYSQEMLNRLQNQNKILTNELKSANSEKDKAKQQLSKLQIDIQSVQKQLLAKEKKIAEQGIEIQCADAELGAKKIAFAELEIKQQILDRELAEKEKKIAGQEVKIAGQEVKINLLTNELESEKNQAKQKLIKLQTEKQSTENQLGASKNIITAKEIEIQRVNKQLRTKQTAFSELEMGKQQVDNLLAEKDKIITRQEMENNLLTNDLETATSEKDQAKQKLIKLQTDVAEQLAERETKIAEQETEKQHMDEQLAAKKKTIAAIRKEKKYHVTRAMESVRNIERCCEKLKEENIRLRTARKIDGKLEKFPGLDRDKIEKIRNTIVHSGEKVTLDDIAGLQKAKQIVNEMMILPILLPDVFTGLREPPKGLLLFGPPGTGKTLIGKAIAHVCRATFFSVSKANLITQWQGSGEQLVQTLYAVAHSCSPAVVFIDEVDSMLTERTTDEDASTRGMKTEFLKQLDGVENEKRGQVLTLGATNKPWDLDTAARRRFVKKVYVPLPDQLARKAILSNLLAKESHTLTINDITDLANATDGFSGADMKEMTRDAALGPVREKGDQILNTKLEDLPPISYKHFRNALADMSPSVSQQDLANFIEWNSTYGNTNKSRY